MARMGDPKQNDPRGKVISVDTHDVGEFLPPLPALKEFDRRAIAVNYGSATEPRVALVRTIILGLQGLVERAGTLFVQVDEPLDRDASVFPSIAPIHQEAFACLTGTPNLIAQCIALPRAWSGMSKTAVEEPMRSLRTWLVALDGRVFINADGSFAQAKPTLDAAGWSVSLVEGNTFSMWLAMHGDPGCEGTVGRRPSNETGPARHPKPKLSGLKARAAAAAAKRVGRRR